MTASIRPPGRVLVTGHRGYIGAVLVPLLLDHSYDVIGVDSDLYAGCDFGAAAPDRVPTLGTDVRDLRPTDLAGVGAVVHLAALSNDPLGDLDPAVTDEINRAASVRLARLARDAGVTRFLFSSSCSNYGAAGDAPVDEDAPLRPADPVRGVQGSRGAGGRPARRQPVQPGLPPERHCVRRLPSPASRPGGQRPHGLGRRHRPGARAERRHAVAPARPRGGHRARVRCDARGAARRGPRPVLQRRRLRENHRVRDLAEIVGRAVPGSRIEYADGAGPDPRSYRVDFAKVGRRGPGLLPRWTVGEGIVQLVRAYRDRRPHAR